MAIERNFTGFEMGDIGELMSGGSNGAPRTIIVSDGTARSGAYFLRTSSLSSAFDLAPFPAGAIVGTSGTVTSGNHKRVSVRAYLRINSQSNNGQIRVFGLGGQNGTCTIFYGAQDVSGFSQSGAKLGLRILTQSHQLGAGAYPWGTVDLVVGTWYRLLLDVDLDVGATTLLSATLRVTEDSATPTVDFTLTNSLNIGATDNVDKLAFGPGAITGSFGKNATVDFDDVVYVATSDADAAAGQPTLPTETKIYAIIPPTGEALNQWSGTHVAVDEYPLSGADIMTSSTAGAEVEFTHASGIALGFSSILATKLYVNASVSGAGTGSVDCILAGVAKNVTFTVTYPGAAVSGGGANSNGGVLWSTLTPAAFSAITFGLKKQNGTQATSLANIGLEVIAAPAAYGSGNQIRGETQIKAGSIYDAQIADAASIARHKVRGLGDGSAPTFFPEESGDDWFIPGPPGASAALVRVPVVPVFMDEGGSWDDGLVIPGPAGATGATGAGGSGGGTGSNGGILVQVVNAEVAAVASGTTVLPNDDTIPQITEGDQYLSLAITPTSATNKLRIDVVIHVSPSVSGNWETAALFQDATANALASSAAFFETATAYSPITFTHYMTAGTTSVTTFKVRAGMGNAGTTTLNGQAAARRLGGVLASSITISEIAPGIGTGTPAHGLVLLAQQAASGSTSLNFVSRNVGSLSGAIFQSDYDEYLVEIMNCVPATNAVNVTLRMSTDGGATFISTTSYRYVQRFQGSAAGNGISNSNAIAQVPIAGLLSNVASSGGAVGTMRVFNPLSSTQEKLVDYLTAFKSSDGNYYYIAGMGALASTTAVNAIQFLMDSGNITSGTIRIYGIVKDATYPVTTIMTGPHATRPAVGNQGRIYLPNDGFTIARDSGTAWETFGPVFPFTAPDDTGFSWVNQGTSTLTAAKDALILVGAAASVANFIGRGKTAPATPYTITAYILANPIYKNNHNWGLYLRQAGAGTGQNRIRGLLLGQFVASNVPGQCIAIWGRAGATVTWTDFTGGSFPIIEPVRWFRITDNGTNTIYSISHDGQTWVQLFSEARTAYLLQGPDEVGFFVDSQNTATPNLDTVISVLSWKQT